MAKKDFKNPAMHFLSEPESEPAAEITERDQDAAARTISTPEPVKEWAEAKSKRFQILLQPSLYEAVKETAYNERMSMNEFIHQTLREKIDSML